MRRLILPLLLLFVVGLAIGVSFTQSPSINNGVTTYTDDDLVCSWNMSDVTSVNVTWYKNGTFYSSENVGLNTSSTISSVVTQRDQNWTCNVTLFNGTNSTTLPAQVTIENSRPTTEGSGAGVFNQGTSTDVGFTIAIDEDEVLTLDVNATDADGETLRYLPADYFCTRLSQTLGTYQCAPTHDDILNGSGPGEEPEEVEIAFTASDGDLVGGRDILFQVIPVNDAPTLSILTQQTNVTAVFNETFNASDEEEDYPLTVSLVNTSPSNIINSSLDVSVEGGHTIRVIYHNGTDYGHVGNHTVLLNLTDARNASTLISFTLEITSVNRNPYFVAFSPWMKNSTSNKTYVIHEGEPLLINITANDPDTNGSTAFITFSDNTSMFVIQTINATATNTSDALGRISFTPTNEDVGNHTVLLRIDDSQGGENTTTINITVTNVNEAPVIYNESHDPENTGGNLNITHLVAYLDAPFFYQVNYSDPDVDIGYDTLNWTVNTSTFNVSSDGSINFTPAGLPRNETINITLRDKGNLSDNKIIMLEVLNNTAPYYTAHFPLLNCSESVACLFDVGPYAREEDTDDNITMYAVSFLNGSLESFTINESTGVINFTPLQVEIGNYTANVTITDTRGASAWQLLNISINNTPDAPVWDASVDFSGQTIVENHEFSVLTSADDQDFLVNGAGENLTFISNISWVNITYQTRINETLFVLISFTPNSSMIGDHALNLTVEDSTSLTDTALFTFTVLEQTEAPNITAIRPYGGVDNQLVEEWLVVSANASNSEAVALTENTSGVIFAVNATDDTTANADLTYSWYYDGVLQQLGTGDGNKSLSFSFDWFSNGTHTMRVMVNDTFFESSSWTWNLNITNVNRPPTFPVNFTGTKNNLSISETNNFNNYFVLEPSNGGFYDPDDDTNENGLIDGSEELNLTYTVSNCQYASFDFDGNNLEVTPLTVGTCYVTFNATDPHGASVESNLVEVTVTEVPQGAESTIVSSGGGGGGTSTRSTFIPFETEVETPEPLNLIAPKLVTIYDNQTVKVPLLLQNNWTAPLKSILLDATSNHTGVDVSFDTDYVEQLDTNATKEVMMTVSGYRLGENFEVVVSANVSDPSFKDTAMILFNSIEQSSEGDAVSVKVTFAKDLLAEHDECQELNELLFKADAQLKTGNVDSAKKMVDVVINGCKYLLSKTQEETQRPGIVKTPLIEMSEETLRLISYIALGVFLIIALLGMFYYHHKTKEEYDF